MSRRGWFWIGYLALVLVVVPASVTLLMAQGQRLDISGGSGGGGIVPGRVDVGIPEQVELQDWIADYNFQSNMGWVLEESTNMTDNFTAPMMFVTLPAADDRTFLLWERRSNVVSFNVQRDERYRVLFFVNAGGAAGANNSLQYTLGDTAFLVRDRIPDGFGVCAMGTNRIFGGITASRWTAFVGDGTDTSFVDMGAMAAGDKFFINAISGGGVDFYLNDVLRASISSPARSSTDDLLGFSMYLGSDATGGPGNTFLGGLRIQREWD